MKKHLKILVITTLYPPQELGGYGRSISDFVWGLIQRGHKVKVLTANANYLGKGEKKGPSGEDVVREIQLHGSFEDGMSLINDAQVCKRIDNLNRSTIQRTLNQESFEGIL